MNTAADFSTRSLPRSTVSPLDASTAVSMQLRQSAIRLQDLVDPQLFTPGYLNGLRESMAAAQPFPHLVVESLFSEELLQLVAEEFEARRTSTLVALDSIHESTYRTPVGAAIGPAAQLYFALVNSGWFVDIVAFICGLKPLIADVHLFGGGLHETRSGGRFDVHVDFDRHPTTGLQNEIVMITYLNLDWDQQWGGALELWRSRESGCERKVWPDFGRTIMMRRTENSFHGHPEGLSPPPGRTRRSLASYYYSNPDSMQADAQRIGATFLKPKPMDHAKHAARLLLPPIVWSMARRVVRRKDPLAP